MQAAKIISESGEMGWQIAMIEVVRSCPIEEKETLLYCGEVFNKENEDTFTKETYIKTGNISLLMNLYGRRQMWTEAAKLADENVGKFDVSVFLPYAEFLVSQDLYEDAMVAYRKAGRSDLAKKVLEELTYNAVSESRFKDAAYHYWLLSKEGEDSIAPSVAPEVPVPEHMKGTPTLAQQQASFEQKADLYFAYANVHAYITDPFTSFQPEMLFQVSRYILNALGSAETIPFGISKAATLYTLARQAMPLGAFKLARHVYDRLSMLQTVHLSKIKKQDEIELDMLIVQAKPVRDDPDILPVCYRCSSTNPLLNPFTNKFAKGDVCTNCGHPFVRSFVNFDILPLVEFIPDPRISDEEAIDLIRQEGNRLKGGRGGKGKGAGWKEGKEGESDMMTLDDDEGPRRGAGYDDYQGSSFGGGDDQDMFTRCVNSTLENQVRGPLPIPLRCCLSMLCLLNSSLTLSLSLPLEYRSMAADCLHPRYPRCCDLGVAKESGSVCVPGDFEGEKSNILQVGCIVLTHPNTDSDALE
jgi:intraflagellar transport protein 122